MTQRTYDQYNAIFDNAITGFAQIQFYTNLLDQFAGVRFPQAPGDCAVMGIRHDGDHVTNDRENTADDTIVLCRVATDGVTKQVFEYKGTTESGDFAQIENPAGDFKMFPGVYFFKKGLHHGVHPCLVQAAAVRGERAKKHEDFAGDFEITDGSLHIHAGINNPN